MRFNNQEFAPTMNIIGKKYSPNSRLSHVIAFFKM